MKIEVVRIVDGPNRLPSGDYSIKVVVSNELHGEFDYQYIKNNKADADKVIVGFIDEMNCQRKWSLKKVCPIKKK